jgi:hypothetical protein
MSDAATAIRFLGKPCAKPGHVVDGGSWRYVRGHNCCACCRERVLRQRAAAKARKRRGRDRFRIEHRLET